MKNGINVATIILSITAIILSCYALLIVSNNKIMISFNTNYDNTLNGIEIIKGESIDLPILERDGYIFSGWYSGKILIDNNYHFRKPTILSAKWSKEVERKTYTIKFETGENGSYAPNQIVKYGEKIKKPEVEINYKEGNFIVCGICGKCPDHIKEWQLDGQKYDFNMPVTDNIILTAVWEYVENSSKECK